MRGIIRVDASVAMGIGHLNRCLVLKALLEGCGAKISLLMDRCSQGFVDETSNEVLWLDESLNHRGTKSTLERYAAKPDFLIVDHYEIDAVWEKSMRPYVGKIMVIDDLANRPHDCDILLDQNLFPASAERYQGLISLACSTFFGPGYALLRPEFFLERSRIRARTGNLKQILINFGGSDPAGMTLKALKGVANALGDAVEIICVAGKANPFAAEIEEFCVYHANMQYYLQTNQMAQLMNWADLAIGAGGSSALERCFLGLPSLVVTIADNQRHVTEQLAAAGVVIKLGASEDVEEDSFCKAVLSISDQAEILKSMGLAGLTIMGDASGRRYEKILTCVLGTAK